MTTKRAVIYARVSTDEQAEHGYSRESQIEACRQYASKNEMKVKAEWREDYSGAKLDRPELDKLRETIRRGEVDVVIVYSPDRFTRNLAHSLILREELLKAGVELHYCNRGKLENTPEGRMTENIEAVFGDYWREKIIEGSMRGRRAKAASGKLVGNALAAYGYKREGKGREVELQIDETETAIVKRIFKMYVYDKKPTRSIAETLTAEGIEPPNRGKKGRGWYHITIKRLIERKAYLGEFNSMGIKIHLPHLAIIDKETFDAAQDRREKNKLRSKRHSKRDYLLSSHLFCSCERRMLGRGGKDYCCAGVSCYKHLNICQEKRINLRLVETLTWDWLARLLLDPQKRTEGLNEYASRQASEAKPKRERVSVIETEVEKFEKKIKRLTKLAGDTDDDDNELAAEYHAQAKQASKTRAELIIERDKLLAEMTQGELTQDKRANIEAWAQELSEGIAANDVSFEAKRNLLDWLNVKAKIAYREGERGVSVSCELRYGDTWLPMDKAAIAEHRQREMHK